MGGETAEGGLSLLRLVDFALVFSGRYPRGGSRTAAYGVALREMRESFAALGIAVRLHCIAPLEPGLVEQCRKIIGTLVRLAFPAGR